MSDLIQPYEQIVRLKSARPKGGGKLPPPFAAGPGLKPQPYEEFVRLTGTWRKGGYKLYTPFADQREEHSTRDDLSRVDPFGRVVGVLLHGGTP